ncbi:hypothetical protein C8R43DRAFT_1085533 [Mycena crocata]|nr:hypothetical protein C8R43DRAFT_1085533 [Mycena crocata]
MTVTPKAIAAASTQYVPLYSITHGITALLYYDFALTFPREVRYMWREKFRLSTALYICCRYALVANVLYLLAIANKLGSTGAYHPLISHIHRCDSWYKIIGALSILGRAAVVAFFSMRTYAVFGKSRWVLAYMSTMGLACIALDIVRLVAMHDTHTNLNSQTHVPANEMLSILMVIFESSSAFLTTIRCVMAFRAGGGLEHQRHGVMFILFEQGQYSIFLVSYLGTPISTAVTDLNSTISIFTTAAVILNYPGFFQRLPNAYTLPLSCLLTARFILYLREWDAAQVDDKGAATEVSVAQFRAGSSSQHSGVLSSIVGMDDFGPDPVELAVAKRENATELHVRRVHSETETDSGGTESDIEMYSKGKVESTVVGGSLKISESAPVL